MLYADKKHSGAQSNEAQFPVLRYFSSRSEGPLPFDFSGVWGMSKSILEHIQKTGSREESNLKIKKTLKWLPSSRKAKQVNK